jgi:hypothetical protein
MSPFCWFPSFLSTLGDPSTLMDHAAVRLVDGATPMDYIVHHHENERTGERDLI